MATLQDYIYLSELVYNVNRSENNKFKSESLGWTEIKYIEHGENDSDFSVGVYQKGNEIVIAFTDTPVVMDKSIKIIFKSF